MSASAGLGGSLVLVPVLTLAFGAKSGISLAALLLAGNNVVKLWAYRRTLPLRASAIATVCTLLGAAIGSRLLVILPEQLAQAIVVFSFAAALLAERRELRALRASLGPVLAVMAGANCPAYQARRGRSRASRCGRSASIECTRSERRRWYPLRPICPRQP